VLLPPAAVLLLLLLLPHRDSLPPAPGTRVALIARSAAATTEHRCPLAAVSHRCRRSCESSCRMPIRLPLLTVFFARWQVITQAPLHARERALYRLAQLGVGLSSVPGAWAAE
jgi:hypothetical protein